MGLLTSIGYSPGCLAERVASSCDSAAEQRTLSASLLTRSQTLDLIMDETGKDHFVVWEEGTIETGK